MGGVNAAAIVAAGVPAPFMRQHLDLVLSSAGFAFDAARLIITLGVRAEDAFDAVLQMIDDELLQFETASALGVAVAVVDQMGLTVPSAWTAHLDAAGLA